MAARKGVVFHPQGRVISKEEQYDRLAALVRCSLNMELLYRIIDLKGD
ncbi:MAG: hypothetical protein HY694_02440 [Deltaproteobacteria bacterium]|nr:hypothetical protein [Deltaproteobacteria bacterium]